MQKSKSRELTYQVGGWLLFIVGTMLFLVASVRSGDIVSLAGSLAFLVGCILFMVPLGDHVKELNRTHRVIRPLPKIRRVKRFMPTPQMRISFRRHSEPKRLRVQPTSRVRLATARKLG